MAKKADTKVKTFLGVDVRFLVNGWYFLLIITFLYNSILPLIFPSYYIQTLLTAYSVKVPILMVYITGILSILGLVFTIYLVKLKRLAFYGLAVVFLAWGVLLSIYLTPSGLGITLAILYTYFALKVSNKWKVLR